MPISNQKEEIDVRVLRLIGVEDVFDLDYDTYLTLLKEAMVKSRMVKKTIPTEEIELLTDEYKRVKGKKDNGRFQVKKKKITAGSFNVGNVKVKSTTKSLLGTAIGKSPLSKSLEDNITAITSSIVSISETLKQQKKISDNTSAYNRRKGEQDKRDLSENKLEKRFEGLKKVAEKIIAPVKSLLDKILEFFTTVILGRIVYKLVEWMGDPKNASKVKSIIRFVKDWWPALLGSYILFGTTFGKFIRGTVGMLGRFIFQIGKVAIPKLLSLIAKNPLASLIVGTSVAGTLARTSERERLKPELDKQRASVEKTEKDSSAPWYQKLGASFAKQELTTGQQRQSIVAPVPGAMFSGGGLASGFVSGEKGVDKIPAMLSDGEFVMSRGAVAKYGVDTLESMNAVGGGTNKPKIVGGVPHAAGGGMIGSDKSYGYRDANTPFAKDPISALNRFIKYKFGADIGKQSTWGTPSNGKTSGFATGSLLNDPVGAVTRIVNNMGLKTPNVPSSSSKKPSSSSGNIFSRGMDYIKSKTARTKSGEKGFFENLKSASYRDAGAIYAKQMLGGLRGPISETDLSKESQAELQKAIQRAKKRTAQQIRIEQSKLNDLLTNPPKPGQDKTEWNNAVATQRSFLKKFKEGGVRVQYADYAEKGKMSESAKNAKNILGQFWAYGRNKKEGGGYRIEDKYDFDAFKDPKTGKPINPKDVLFGKNKTTQQRLQAAFLMNPLAAKQDVNMVLGGKRNASDAMNLGWQKSFVGRMTNQMFGQKPIIRQPGGARTKAQLVGSKPNIKPIKPPVKANVRVVRTKANTIGTGGGGGRKLSTQKTPSFSASTKGWRTKTQTMGLLR